MPRVAKEVSTANLRKLMAKRIWEGKLGEWPVGGVPGLVLDIRETGTAYWIFRTHIAGKRRRIGIGGYPEYGLLDARDAARELRRKVREGYDPIAERHERKAALREEQHQQITFREHWGLFMQVKRKSLKSQKTANEWDNMFKKYALPYIGNMLVKNITMHDIRTILMQPVKGGTLWEIHNPTASKLRKRLLQAFKNAKVMQRYTGDNPAEWRGGLGEVGVLAKPSAVHIGQNYPSLPFPRAPEFIVELKKRGGNATRALEFAILTAVRSKEVRGATWSECDLEKAVWRIPGERMKGGLEHNVPLSDAALALLNSMPKDNEFIFPARRGGKMTDMALSSVIKRMHDHELKAGHEGWVDPHTLEKDEFGELIPGAMRRVVPHGFRSTFKDWCTEETDVPDFISEMALAHKVGNEVRQAYQRSDLLAKRRGLMRDWARHLGYQERGAKVVRMEARV